MQLKILLGKRIRELRKLRKMTQERLAELVEIDYKNIGKIETGQNYPSAATLEKLAAALGVREFELFEFEHHKEEDVLESQIVEIYKAQTPENRKLIFKILKAFE
ncbi:TPA: helix-turn-helix transcriptional regulator [Candidatus Spyradomonas excrementavium]|nr:helix-turn-helix transcriptional regulator [Candidatus Spyradomonas excrementavium]